jgi:Mannosylglycerate hydrolase MGH1-like glycoside hydrolase domain
MGELMNSKAPYLIKLIAATLLVATVAVAQVHIPWGVPGREYQAPAGTAEWLTPEMLGMPRSQIVFTDRMLRLFNGRGAISVRDQSVTGLQRLQFPPIAVRHYKFYLAFREAETGTLIQDIVPEGYEHSVRTEKGPNPLGYNSFSSLPYVMLLQHAYWQPNAYYRTGTFHKELKGHWISFRIKTKASVSAAADEIYLRVEVENRESEPLVLTAIPDQRAAGLSLRFPNEKSTPATPVTHPSFNTLQNNEIRISVVSSLSDHNKAGWHWAIAGHSKRTADFAIILQRLPASQLSATQSDIAQREEAAAEAERDQLRWAASQLPEVSTSDPAFDDLYRRAILTVLMSRWDRKNFVLQPFYAAGSWVNITAWDTSYVSEMLSLLDPAGLRKALLLRLDGGLLKYSYVPWNGKTSPYWYAQGPFAAMRILKDYLRQTGDTSFLNRAAGDATVFEKMKQVGLQLEKRFSRPDGLLDFGPGSERILEIRTDGEQHIVAADNGMAAAYFRQMAAWCHARNDPDAAKFDQWAARLHRSINQKLWDPKAGWFVNLYPDGSRHLVWSYHQFSLLDTGILSAEQQHLMVSHIKEGEFLGPYGMYSISKANRTHWDLEDVDWGGGGQYAGKPFRIAESLYRLGYAETAWDILARCTRWTNHFPYIPQEIFADSPRYPEVEMPIALSAGSGVQAILFGVFGLRPQANGSLDIAPSYRHELGVARMTGYKFRGHTYGVVMGPWNYEVYRDGQLAARNVYGETTVFPSP